MQNKISHGTSLDRLVVTIRLRHDIVSVGDTHDYYLNNPKNITTFGLLLMMLLNHSYS
jgi:hypothetical protein